MPPCLRPSSVRLWTAAGLLWCLAIAPLAHAGFVNFESGHVRPLALSPDGSLLLAVNTPDNRLEIYNVTAGGLALAAEVEVGLEPVAVATRTNANNRTEAWVVNHLSDSVSIVEVDLDPLTPALSRVTRTLLVGDEPRDIVFAGPGRNRAFITCARRGQNRFPTNPDTDPQLTTPGTGRADVWAFDATSLGAPFGGSPLSIIQLRGDTPRALTASADGSTVFAAVFQSGNRTTAVTEALVTARGGLPRFCRSTCSNAGLPCTSEAGCTSCAGTATKCILGSASGAPNAGLIVKFNPANNRWEDEVARNWTTSVPFSLPDEDVFLIDANASPPARAGGTNVVTGVGTVLFNMAVRPSNGKVYVANTDALNRVRFEPNVHGHIAESRVTVITGTSATSRHLNPHINYGVTPGSQSEIDQSLAFPMGMAFSADASNSLLFVAGFGSGKVAVVDANALEAGNITAATRSQFVSLVTAGGGPSGLVLDTVRDRLYVMNRFDQTISVVTNASLPTRAQGAVVPLRFDPSPANVRNGRRFLYDASVSGHGDSACASCHIFGDFDSLAWDLGDPFGTVVPNPNPFIVPVSNPQFHPLKGPMTTQSLRGMATAGPMHWRGDRTGGTTGGDPLDETLAFKAFNPAFVGLLGAAAQLTTAQMQAFTDFILTVQYPPNPIRALNNQPTNAQSLGDNIFRTGQIDAGTISCSFCHNLPMGTAGLSSFEGEPQEFKVAHLRNAYQKVGMFASSGAQIRGFGFLHDGSIATVFDFLHASVFQFTNGDTDRRNLEAFIMAFDTGLRPIVGQQVSITSADLGDPTHAGTNRLDLLIARDDAGDCELVMKGVVAGLDRGAVYVGGNNFQTDRNGPNGGDALVTKAALLALAAVPGQEQMYTCVPPGSGVRIGVDRDEDGFFDRWELDAGSDPADPMSTPFGNVTTSTTTSSTTSTSSTTLPFILIPTRSLSMKDDNSAPIDLNHRKISFKSDTRFDTVHIIPPSLNSAGDPRTGGAVLHVYNSAGLTSDDVTVVLPPGSRWSLLGRDFDGYEYRDTDPAAAISKLKVKVDQITVKGGHASWAYTLNEAMQGRVALKLQLGSAPPWCTEAPAKVSGTPPTTDRNDHVDKFTAQPKSPAPGACPTLGSPSGAFLDGEAEPFD